MSVTRPRYKVDANQNAIVDALLAAGCAVQSLAMCGAGVPDLLVAAHGQLYLLEVKQPGEKLTPYQRKWQALWAAIVLGLFTRLQRQRKELADARLVLRLYRETRSESDTQVRALLTQNERLARKLIDLAAGSMPSMTAESLSALSTSTTFHRRES